MRWNQKRLQEQLGDHFQHAELKPTAIPFDDFDTNAVVRLNLPEATRQSCPL